MSQSLEAVWGLGGVNKLKLRLRAWNRCSWRQWEQWVSVSQGAEVSWGAECILGYWGVEVLNISQCTEVSRGAEMSWGVSLSWGTEVSGCWVYLGVLRYLSCWVYFEVLRYLRALRCLGVLSVSWGTECLGVLRCLSGFWFLFLFLVSQSSPASLLIPGAVSLSFPD